MKYLDDLKILGDIIDMLLQRRDRDRVRVNEAITSISFAWTHTYDYLRNNQGEFVHNQELSDLWLTAAGKTRLVDLHLANQLQDKARFWIHPNLPRQNNILLLTEVVDEIERLNRKLQ